MAKNHDPRGLLSEEFNAVLKAHFPRSMNSCRDFIELLQTNGLGGDKSTVSRHLDRCDRLIKSARQYAELYEFYGAVSIGQQDGIQENEREEKLERLAAISEDNGQILAQLVAIRANLNSSLDSFARPPGGRGGFSRAGR